MNTKTSFLFLISVFVGCLSLLTYSCNTMVPEPILVIPRDEAPAWSPDGKYIAYNHFNPEAGENESAYSLRILDLTTMEDRLVLDGFAMNPDWSPDGEWLAFSSGDIFKVRPDGTDLQQITNVGSAFFPSWSPDGEMITYGRSGTQEEVGLWFVNLENLRNSKFGFGAPPADWSPSGDKIVYEFLNDANEEGGNQIWTADTTGANKIQLTVNEFQANRAPAWSPDGEWIAWSTLGKGIIWGLWVMRSDGSDQKKLLTINNKERLSFEQIDPAWSPDSQQILFSKPTKDQEKVALWLINRDGSGLTQLTF